MTQIQIPDEVRMVPLEKIEILNPRERNNRVFEEIVENIKTIGLKKPITVTTRLEADGSERFQLVCGEGRLKAFRALGETAIPALVVTVNDEDAFIMSLVENIARRQYRPLELLTGIERLHDQGYDKKQIAVKTGLKPEYVYGILRLLKHGEERLLDAVEKGRLPITAALTILEAGDDDKSIQVALQDAYESGKLRGKHLRQARKAIERRQIFGRGMSRTKKKSGECVTSSSLVRTYQKEVARQRLMIKKAEFAQQRLMFVIGALRELFSDENFANLLRAEGLDSLPKYLADRVWAKGMLT